MTVRPMILIATCALLASTAQARVYGINSTQTLFFDDEPTLYGVTAVFDGGVVFRGNPSDLSQWFYSGTLRPLNWANGAGGGTSPNYRDDFLLTQTAEGHPRDDARVTVYVEQPGGAHARNLGTRRVPRRGRSS